MACKMAFDMIRLTVSQIPIDLTPGHLSRAIRRQAITDERLLGSTNVVQSLLARRAREWHR